METVLCLIIMVINVIDIVCKSRCGRAVKSECIRTESHRAGSDTTTFRSIFLIDGKEYTEERARNTVYSRQGKKCRVILKDDGTVIDFRCVRTDIGLIIFIGFFAAAFLPSAIEQII